MASSDRPDAAEPRSVDDAAALPVVPGDDTDQRELGRGNGDSVLPATTDDPGPAALGPGTQEDEPDAPATQDSGPPENHEPHGLLAGQLVSGDPLLRSPSPTPAPSRRREQHREAASNEQPAGVVEEAPAGATAPPQEARPAPAPPSARPVAPRPTSETPPPPPPPRRPAPEPRHAVARPTASAAGAMAASARLGPGAEAPARRAARGAHLTESDVAVGPTRATAQQPTATLRPTTVAPVPRLAGRRPRVRRVTRVVRHVDPWSVFKVAAAFSAVAYVIALVAGVLLWQVAYATGTIDNIERGMESTGWEVFELDGDEIFRNAWVGGLFIAVGMTGLAVLVSTLFNLITDLVGGIRLTVLEEEVIEKTASPMRRFATSQESPGAEARVRRARGG